MDYRLAGVDISKGERLVGKIKAMMGSAGAGIGHFGGSIPLNTANMSKPLLVSSIDGVGTKMKIAQKMQNFGTVGMDLVHHCINDIACCGAEPITFLDYIAMAVMDVDVAAEVIGGIVEACGNWNVALVGGENAEMPGVYVEGELDLVGCITGLVDQKSFIDGSTIADGDVLIGFASLGLHTNGYSLAREIVKTCTPGYYHTPDGWSENLGNILLANHKCYLKEIQELKNNYAIKGLAHITGGGLEGNTSRIVPKGLKANFDWNSWQTLDIFSYLQEMGKIADEDMRSSFNLGIGLVAITNAVQAQEIVNNFPVDLVPPQIIGKIISEQ